MSQFSLVEGKVDAVKVQEDFQNALKEVGDSNKQISVHPTIIKNCRKEQVVECIRLSETTGEFDEVGVVVAKDIATVVVKRHDFLMDSSLFEPSLRYIDEMCRGFIDNYQKDSSKKQRRLSLGESLIIFVDAWQGKK